MRDSKKSRETQIRSLGEFPDDIIFEISKWIVYYFAVGKSDITGEDWGDIFSKGIGGNHLASPLGLADVAIENDAWSVKSVKDNSPHKCKRIRIISGRNSPDYSYGIQNPHDDPEKTGRAVLNIWNERVNIATEEYTNLRSATLIRNINSLQFTLFEKEIGRFNTKDYSWTVNKNGNLEGRDNNSKEHVFTWQPHGSQFTVIHKVPESAIKFQIKRPSVLDFNQTIKQIGFDNSWVTIK